MHAVKRGNEPKSIVGRNLGRIFGETLHVNQASGLVDDVSVKNASSMNKIKNDHAKGGRCRAAAYKL